MLLENKIAVITGAGRGIGKAIAEAYAAAGQKSYAPHGQPMKSSRSQPNWRACHHLRCQPGIRNPEPDESDTGCLWSDRHSGQ